MCTSKEKYYFPSELRTSQTMLYTQTPVIELNRMTASYSLIFDFLVFVSDNAMNQFVVLERIVQYISSVTQITHYWGYMRGLSNYTI